LFKTALTDTIQHNYKDKTMKTAIVTTTTTVIKQQSLNLHDSASSLSETNLEILDDTEFELERIMFEEFAKGLPSDIPMADF
jgi:hypothetical protein